MAKKKRKRKLKRIVKIFLGLLIVIVLVLLYLNINNKDIILKNDLTIELGSDIKVSDIIESSKYKVINKEDKIDTSKLGNKEIIIKYKKNNKNNSYIVKIKIIDSEKPVISTEDEINVTIGSNAKIEDMIDVSDNSGDDIDISIDGDYDLKKKGEYQVTIIATDSSGNKSSKKVKINVLDNLDYNADGSLIDGIYTTNKGYTVKIQNGVASINDIIIVNKTYSLPSTYTPKKPYKSIAGRGYCTDCMEDFVVEAFLKMKDDASREGLKLWVGSGFRSYDTQKMLYNNYVNKDGKEAADTYSARAGYSEHQSGLCFDLNSDSDAFTNTKEGKWVNDNAYKYGFVIRFPKNKEEYTGYEYESWHLRYVGEDLAKKLYNNGDWISLEEYFGITSKYPD